MYDLVIAPCSRYDYDVRCGKKPELPADTTAPTQTESQTEASAEETTKPDETPSETQVPEDTESTKFYMLQGRLQKQKKTAPAFTLLADDGNEYTIALSDIRDVETEIEKNIQIAIACMKDASGDPEKAAYIVAFPESGRMDHFHRRRHHHQQRHEHLHDPDK